MSEPVTSSTSSSPATDDSGHDGPLVPTPAAEHSHANVKQVAHDPHPPTVKLPGQPRVAAGWKIPGASSLKIRKWMTSVSQVAALEPERRKLEDGQLRKESLSLRYRAMSGEPLGSLLAEAFSLVREAGRRALNMRHFDVQLLGGAALFDGCIAEMQTGEFQVKFSDYRSVGGLQLPFKWTQTVDGKADETVEISNYEINPANITEKFREPKIFIRHLKEQQ